MHTLIPDNRTYDECFESITELFKIFFLKIIVFWSVLDVDGMDRIVENGGRCDTNVPLYGVHGSKAVLERGNET